MTKFRMLHPKEKNASTCKPTVSGISAEDPLEGTWFWSLEMLGKWLVNGDMNDKIEEKSDGPRVSHSKFRSFDRRRCCHSAGWAYSDPPMFHPTKSGPYSQRNKINPALQRIPKVRRFSNNPHMFGARFDCVETKWHTPKKIKKKAAKSSAKSVSSDPPGCQSLHVCPRRSRPSLPSGNPAICQQLEKVPKMGGYSNMNGSWWKIHI